MAKMSFDAMLSNNNSGTSGSNNNTVGILSLKNDGDEAIVRIMHDSVDDFDILTYHPVHLGGKTRSVNCIRDPREPLDNCPLCKSGTKILSRIFIHLIQYTMDAEGKIVARPMVWERPAAYYATKLKNDIEEYGPLSNCIFKIKRNGKAGDKNTTYELKLGNPNMYNEASYPKIEGAFDNYSVCGTIVMDKSFDEMNAYLTTGNFPDNRKSGNDGSATVANNTPVGANRSGWNQNPSTADTPPWQSSAGGHTQPAGTTTRPTRYY